MSNKLILPPSFFSQIDIDEIDCVGRVVGEEKSVYIILNYELNEFIIHKTQKSILSVGDWVIFEKNINPHSPIIKRVLTPINTLSRNKNFELQFIATNIDKLLIITSANEEFNLNRIERYIQLAENAQLTPIVVLTKIDLINTEEVKKYINSINSRNSEVNVLCISVLLNIGLDDLDQYLSPNETVALMGSSGVGKSTLINYLKGRTVQKIQNIGNMDKGKHTTTSRKMFLLENGCFIIDNPGIRSVPISDYNIISDCKFTNCTHTNEPGCGILEKLQAGQLSTEQYNNMLKLKKESEYFQSKSDPILNKKRKQAWKVITKSAKKKL